MAGEKCIFNYELQGKCDKLLVKGVGVLSLCGSVWVS